VPCSVPDLAGGRPPVRHRTQVRPQQVRCAIHGPVLTGTGHRAVSVPDSAAADNAVGNQRYRRRATTRNNQSQTIMTITQ